MSLSISIVPHPQKKHPQLVPMPFGTITTRGDDYAVLFQDHTMEERPSSLPRTNAIQRDRPAEPEGMIENIITLLTGWHVYPSGKIIVPLDKGYGPVYWQFFVDVQGEWAAYKMLGDGNGFFDTANRWGFMCAPTGGDLQHIIGEINQNGTWYDVVERFDFSVMPERFVDDDDTIRWFYKKQECSYELTPHLFATRTNRSQTNNITFVTAGGVNNISGEAGGKEHWPLVANRKAVQPRRLMRRYPSLPRLLNVHFSSLVVDGNLVDPVPAYITIMADAYCFRGSNTFVRELGSGDWYKADEMLVRAEEPYAAKAYDYHCYVSEDGHFPWMTEYNAEKGYHFHRCYRSPIPNWKRWN